MPGQFESNMLPRRFRKATIQQRRQLIISKTDSSQSISPALPASSPAKSNQQTRRTHFSYTGQDQELLHLSESMIEQAIGYHAVPLALAGPLHIDKRKIMIPMATEEPSVVAAVSCIGRLISEANPIETSAGNPIMMSQIFVEDLKETHQKVQQNLLEAKSEIRRKTDKLLATMTRRCGGWQDMKVQWLEKSQVLVVELYLDVRNSMGANLLNTVAEQLRKPIEKITGGRVLMGILSNRATRRIASAQIRLPVSRLSHFGFSGSDVARRIVLATEITRENHDRATTHNKGIMNGISALALATGNDTRAIEAAAHSYACKDGHYTSLSHFWIDDDFLRGELKLPLPFAVTGGAVSHHPGARWALEFMGSPSSSELSRIAAAAGLAQNLAALRALVSEGIQNGHMALHARRLAYLAGARDIELNQFAHEIHSREIRNAEEAEHLFREWAKDKE